MKHLLVFLFLLVPTTVSAQLLQSKVTYICETEYQVTNESGVTTYTCKKDKLDHELNRLTVYYGALVAVDVSTTMYLLGSGKAEESNPLMKSMAKHPMAFGLIKGAINTALPVIVRSYVPKNHRKKTMTALILIYSAVAINNSIVYLNSK